MATAASSNAGATLVSAGTFVHLLSADGGILSSVDVLPISQAVPLSKSADGTEKKEQLKFHDNFQVLATAFSNRASLAAVATSAKTVVIFNVEGDSLSSRRVFRIPKTPTALVFDRQDAHLIVADRAGVVRKYSIEAEKENKKEHLDDDDADETDFEGAFVCSAISMMLDVQFSRDGRLLLVTDRDEKIRVHRYPQTFVLHQLLLAHKDYVATAAVAAVGERQLAFTAGGDGLLIGWDYESGLEVCRSEEQQLGAVRRLRLVEEGPATTRLLALLHHSPTVIVLRVEKDAEGVTIKEEKRLDLGEGVRGMDVTVVDKEKAMVVTSSGIAQLSLTNGSLVWTEIGQEQKDTLAGLKDAIPDMTKKVAFDNMAEYLQRKQKKIEGSRNKKRKNGDESISEPPLKKVDEEEITVAE